MEVTHYEMKQLFKKIQFIHEMPSDKVVACYHGRFHFTLNQIFQIPLLHQVYHLYIKLEDKRKAGEYEVN